MRAWQKGFEMAKDEPTQESLAEIERLRSDLAAVADLIDDVLYYPKRVFDEYGDEIKGAAKYLLDTPVMTAHLPALRSWFVSQSYSDVER